MKEQPFVKITNRDIYDRINESEKMISHKFNEVITRQDRTNGRLLSAEKDIEIIKKNGEEKSRSFEDWSRKKLIFIGGIVITIIMFFGQFIAQLLIRKIGG